MLMLMHAGTISTIRKKQEKIVLNINLFHSNSIVESLNKYKVHEHGPWTWIDAEMEFTNVLKLVINSRWKKKNEKKICVKYI